MKIFLSWSGPRSRAIAKALHQWLPTVIQSVKTFYSDDIEKGTKGLEAISSGLDGTNFGIICLTPENLNSTWIHYEAGALSKVEDKSRVWTVLRSLEHTDVEYPLAQYQHTKTEKEDFLKLLLSIDNHLEEKLGEPRLKDTLEKWWPDLDSKLKEADQLLPTSEDASLEETNIRSDREILNEILDLVRRQNNPPKFDLSLLQPIQSKQTSYRAPKYVLWDEEPSLVLEASLSLPTKELATEESRGLYSGNVSRILTLKLRAYGAKIELYPDNENDIFDLHLAKPIALSELKAIVLDTDPALRILDLKHV